MRKTTRWIASALICGAAGAAVAASAQDVSKEKTVQSRQTASPAIPVVPADTVRKSAEQADEALRAQLTTASAPSRILMRPGVNEIIPVAMFHANRIVTPFKHPQVISSTLTASTKPGESGEVSVRGSSVYITTDKNHPVSAFITERGSDAVALSVTLIPKRIPPREIELRVTDDVKERIAAGEAVTGSRSQAESWETSQPFVDTIRETFRLVAKGEVPPGYAMRGTKATDRVPVCKQPGLKFDFRNGQFLRGANLNVFVGIVKNVADKPVEIREQNCGAWNVAGAASWPLKVLRPGQTAEMYVAVRQEEEPAPGTVRRSLIRPEYN